MYFFLLNLQKAGESLGAIGDPSVIEILEEYKNNPIPEVCHLVL